MSSRKIEFEELFNSTTMFYVNEDYEEEMEQEVQKKVDELAAELHSIDTKEGLKAYIIDHKDALDNLTSRMITIGGRGKYRQSAILRNSVPFGGIMS